MKSPWVALTACFLLVLSFSAASARPWVVAANIGRGVIGDLDYEAGSLYTIDIGVNPPQVYGPFLAGQLVAANDPDTGSPLVFDVVLDVVQIPRTNNVLISSYFSAQLNLVSLADPAHPVLLDTLTL